MDRVQRMSKKMIWIEKFSIGCPFLRSLKYRFLFGLSFFVHARELSLGINIFNRGSRLGWIKFEDAYKMSFKIMANIKIKYSINKSLRLDLKKP
jgi:hypothetical protein